MDRQLIMDAFEVPNLDNLREKQRRLVYHIEYLEKELLKTQQVLQIFRKAAADCWLSEHLTND